MRISIGGQTQDAMEVLGIEAYPFTSGELSVRFRHLIKLHHPDRNENNPTAKEITQKLLDAYQHLKNLAIVMFVGEKQEQEARRIFEEDEDMFSIWDTCPRCSGLRIATCSKCNGLGKIKLNPFNPVIRKGAILSTFA